MNLAIEDSYSLTPAGLWVPQEVARQHPIGIDLFAGAGGFSLGMEWAGFDVAVAVEWDPTAAITYALNLGMQGGRFVVRDERRAEWERALVGERKRRRSGRKPSDIYGPDPDEPGFFGINRPNLKGGANSLTGDGCRAVMVADIAQLSGAEILDAGRLEPGSVDVVFGGPPCQGFSRAGKQDPADPRSNLILEFLRIVVELQPKTFVMENVPPLISEKKFLPLWEEWQRRALAAGYDITADVLDAVNYGVPQRRRRAIVVGTRRDVSRRPFQMPMPTHWEMGVSPEHSWNMGGHAASHDDGQAGQAGLFDEI